MVSLFHMNHTYLLFYLHTRQGVSDLWINKQISYTIWKKLLVIIHIIFQLYCIPCREDPVVSVDTSPCPVRPPVGYDVPGRTDWPFLSTVTGRPFSAVWPGRPIVPCEVPLPLGEPWEAGPVDGIPLPGKYVPPDNWPPGRRNEDQRKWIIIILCQDRYSLRILVVARKEYIWNVKKLYISLKIYR